MSASQIEHALKRVGDVLELDVDVEILVVGGAAGMLTGLLPPTRTTTDCDVMLYVPEHAMPWVEIAGEKVGRELGISPEWLNSKVQIRADSLPLDWRRRRIWVGTYGRMWVYAVSRPDLIAMKVLAGRDRDRDDLRSLKVQHHEAEFVRAFLDQLPARGMPLDQIEDARVLLDSLKLYYP